MSVRSRAGMGIVTAMVAGVSMAGCTGLGHTGAGAPPPVASTSGPGAPVVYVAVGASETVGFGSDNPVREAWPQLLFHQSLPLGSSLVVDGIPGATVADAIFGELSLALEVQPTVVTVWLNVNDLIAGVGVPDYANQLRVLVDALRRQGAARVLVANTPPLDDLPAYRACRAAAGHNDPAPAVGGAGLAPSGPCLLPRPETLPAPAGVAALVAAYNHAIAEVVAAAGATLVDLHAAGLAARADGSEASLVSDDGFHPSDAGHRAVAAAFAAALAAAR